MKNFNFILMGITGFLVLVLLLTSCEQSSQKGSDGYNFESKEFERTEISLSVVVIPDQSEFDRLQLIHAPTIEGLQAFSYFSLRDNHCTIFIKDPEWSYEPEFIGHELAHCIWGRWHQKRNEQERNRGLR